MLAGLSDFSRGIATIKATARAMLISDERALHLAS
jgi:hypothetical protein